MVIDRVLDFLGRRLARYLTAPIPDFQPSSTTDFELLCRSIRPADVLLVEGNSRIATAIKYLTQSTWSHSALYVGPIEGGSGEPRVLIEANVNEGVVAVPLSKYRHSHTRICRPVGLSETARQQVVAFALARLGVQYDIRNIVDLVRYLLPTPPVPSRFRRRMIALGSGQPTRAICSTLIAQAFQSASYPILPRVERVDEARSPIGDNSTHREILHIRHHSLFAPRDFDISPYFAIVKPTIEEGFDYTAIDWGTGDGQAAA
jgi:hypothetical protein